MFSDGKRMGLYHEDGEVDLVEVVEDLSDEEWERFRLKCVRVVQKSRIVKEAEAGEEFEVCRRKNAGGWGGDWCLEEDGISLERELEKGTS